ncbi:glucose-1-phosphate adenylyltransferase subunit GlgD [Paenibacillus sacheonensis]|uniref:Glucose-1-phosphate adenylyltransferase subunit GlgD n=1 Tax=Paenibacillus sacheonensis TaxID=742054 RepID=A0A7X4YUW1_9BACL|nr:glucose-1-phosphate adenylyltransferase subunit GlgD [Paenibacillus sacheonensis]MBM7568104.1 glucose-1-phosphate adenylyltransferase [Paenibacillus sacheonensis]NBC71894.1 glucose-1-phosphate adenylyltransferase subunit GlgD [Paenibacillus sacheonensis]
MKLPMLGIINLIHETDEMGTLTQGRCLATVPFGGRYRLIDFVLSSMVNSGMQEVAVFAHTKYRSLMEHLGTGTNWDLHRKQNGLFVLPPAIEDQNDFARGDLYHFYRNRDYFARSPHEYVAICRSHMVCNVDFEDVLRHHRDHEADITVVCKANPGSIVGLARKVRVDETGRIKDIQDHYGRLSDDVVSMEMYILRKDLLIDLIETSLAQGRDHFVRHAVFSRLDQLKVSAYMYDGVLGIVNNIASYFRHSMELLQPEIGRELFFRPGPIYSKGHGEPPTRFLTGADVNHSLVANGCEIDGIVENSILFRGVKVKKGAVVRNSIVMQNSVIGEDGSLESCILDKEVEIQPFQQLRGVPDMPFLALKRKVI